MHSHLKHHIQETSAMVQVQKCQINDPVPLKPLDNVLSSPENGNILSHIYKERLVFFDLETSGLGGSAEILQISAVYGKQQFDVYCLPTRAIPKQVSWVNHLTFDGSTLFHRKKPVYALSLLEGVYNFVKFLEDINCPDKLILVAHNAKFDSRFITKACYNLGYLDRIIKSVEGFLCTLSLFRHGYPTLSSFKQKDLVSKFLGNEESNKYDAHNAIHDVIYLQDLFHCKLSNKSSLYQDSSFTFQSSVNKLYMQQRIERDISSFDLMIRVTNHCDIYNLLLILYTFNSEKSHQQKYGPKDVFAWNQL